MNDPHKLATSDDDDDLEALRLAALQSFKKRNTLNMSQQQLPNQTMNYVNSEKSVRYNRPVKGIQNKRRFFGPHQGRNGKNGQFNSRIRNTNLISIPTIPNDIDKLEENRMGDSRLGLSLLQDQYGCKEEKKENAGEGSSKFNRYNNSDKSETESEEEEITSEGDAPGKLEKSDSLEALMQELDDEIQGKSKVKGDKVVKDEKPKLKKTKKKKLVTSAETKQVTDNFSSEDNSELAKRIDNIKKDNETVNKEGVHLSELKDSVFVRETRQTQEDNFSPAKKRPRSKSPLNQRNFPSRRRQRSYMKLPNPTLHVPYPPALSQYPPPIIPFASRPFNPMFGTPNITTNPLPSYFERPLSPLAINTESLTAATLAPLSPRSAAFVLQNKAIIEKRKRSPKRSYSRSLSRSPRRSLSPRRSISPRRISRSPRRLSRSPIKRRSLSPRRRSVSPRRRNIGKSNENSPKNRPPIRERLGLKPNKSEENKDKLKDFEGSLKKEEKLLDPILEARKRKFESNEIKMKEGIIRLKPKEEKSVESSVNIKSVEDKLNQVEEKSKEPDEYKELEKLLNEEALLEGDDIELDHKVDDIFSDEDSASDNEGRFKVKQQIGEKPSVPSFTKLVNGVKEEIKTEALSDLQKNRKGEKHHSRFDQKKGRSRTLVEKKSVDREEEEKKTNTKKVDYQEKTPVKNRINLKNERRTPTIEKKFERKIEIKIKNPSKYERNNKLKFTKNKDGELLDKMVVRKIEVGDGKIIKKEEIEGEIEPEIVVENDSGDEENSSINEGDLRAQLSKKRAEKLHRIPAEGVSSRLLQYALQGAVFKKSRKNTKEQDITNSDGKLPIHLRLGIAHNSDIFTDTKLKRKTRKRKNREVLEQV